MDQVNQPNIHKLSILNWNANGLTSRRMTFIDFLVRHDIDVACISETHFVPSQTFKIPNYRVYRSDRFPIQPHGGVAIFVKKNISQEAVVLPPMTSFEIQGVLISLANGSLIRIFATYLQPRKTLSAKDIDKIFYGQQTPTIVAGDLNCKHPAWFSLVPNPNGMKLFKLLNQSDWIVLAPDEPTYYPTHQGRHPDVLDLLLCKNIPNVISQQVLAELDSDHSPVVIQLDAVSLQCPSKLKLVNGPVDWDLFRDKMEKVDIPSTFESIDDIDGAVELLTDTVKNTVRQCSGPPKKTNNTFVLPYHLRMLISYKHRIRRKWQRNRYAADKKLLNIITKKLKFQLDQFRYESYQEYLKDLHPEDGSLYKETKRILRERDSIPPMKVGENFITSIQGKCELFASSLEDTFTVNERNFHTEHVNEVKEFLSNEIPSVELPVPYVTPSELQTEIKFLKHKKSPGHDLISNEVIQELPFKAILFLTAIFNACLRWKYFPDQWKHAQVTVIAKPGKPKRDLKSYRPISLLPCLSKLFEKVIASRLKSVLSDWNVLPSFQFGFRESHSTTHQMVKFSEFVNSHFENRNQVTAVFLDLQQAFDRVWHEGLLYKMKKLNFPHYLMGIISSFLQNRSFAVRIEEHFSTIRPVRASVPQGSVLGPILFNLYVSDIASNLLLSPSSFIGMFADDILIACSNKDLWVAQSELQIAANEVVKWCFQWCVTVSVQKTDAKIFTLSHAQDPPCLTINNMNVPWKKDSVRWLGVWFDRRLSWKDHISTKVAEGYQRLWKLYPIFNKKSSLGMKSALLVYKSIILPVVTYGSPVWLPAARTHWKKVEVFQNKILRIISKAPWFVQNERIRKDLNVEPIYDICVQRYIEFIKDNTHNLGHRGYVRRKGTHLPQNLPVIVNALLEGT